ncbi:stalk domain-containing protein [Paenibacillus algicola]|nr:GDSL-type esterase/lipase family protein [Paenibacillus algicola]
MSILWRNRLFQAAGSLTLAVFMLSASLGGKPSAIHAASSSPPEPFRIVSLGDSLTVGYEPGMDLNSKPYGFVERLLEQGLLHGRTETVNLGIAGLKVEGLKHYVQAIADGRSVTADDIQPLIPDPRTEQIGREAPAARAFIEKADLITVTIGGNDMYNLTSMAGAANADELAKLTGELFELYTLNVTEVVHRLHSMNPDAVIVLADQYNPIPELAGKALYAKLNQAAALFTGHIEGLAKQFSQQGISVKVAPVAKEFVGREMTMTHILRLEDIHPNQYGYETMAKVFANTIWGSYTKPAAAEPGQPMNIIVNGKVLNTPYKPVLVKNQNYVAIQDIVNAIGATTVWSNETLSATVTYKGRTVVITIGSNHIKVNGSPVPLTTPAFLHKVGKEHKTYVPLSALVQGLGLDVQYHQKLKTVFINP